MRSRSVAFAEYQRDPQRAALVVCVIWTAAGARAYSAVGLTDTELWTGPGTLADGGALADGSMYAGADLFPTLAREPRVLRYGVIREDGSFLPPLGPSDLRGRRISGVEVALRNDDDHFGRALAFETFLSARLNLTLGFRGLRRDQFVERFQGIIESHDLTRETFTVRAEAA
jgi:hypothetical protein